MTTETVLSEFHIDNLSAGIYGVRANPARIDFARAIEQAVLQSAEVQALREDARRYRFAAQHCVLGGGVYKFGWPVAPVGKRQFDKYLDAAMEKQP